MRKKLDRTTGGKLGSVVNALNILRMLADDDAMRVTDVARELDVSLSTAHRLLSTMRQMGFVEQEPRRRTYRAGWELVRMWHENSGRLEIREKARQHLQALRDQFDETANLLVVEGRHVRFIDGVEGSNPVRVAARTGQRTEAHGSAAGKVLLAERSMDDVRSLYKGVALTRLTPHTIGHVDALLEELALVRRRGYATNFGESVKDLNAVGVKVVDPSGHAVAALTLSAPANRLHKSDVPRVVAALMLSSTELTRSTYAAADNFHIAENSS